MFKLVFTGGCDKRSERGLGMYPPPQGMQTIPKRTGDVSSSSGHKRETAIAEIELMVPFLSRLDLARPRGSMTREEGGGGHREERGGERRRRRSRYY
jgi:hypothetical protein